MAAAPTFPDFDVQFPQTVRLPTNGPWIEILNDAKDKFEVDGAVAVFSKWKVEEEDPFNMGDMRIADGVEVRADKIDPVKLELKKGWDVVKITRATAPGILTGIDNVYYQNAYPVTAVVYGLYPLTEPDPTNLAPMRVGNFNCVAQRVVEYFESALRDNGLTEIRRQKIQWWEAEVRDRGATVDDVANLETIIKRPIVLKDIAGEYIYDSGKYQACKWKPIELIVHNAHAWPRDLHFPTTREVHIYEGDVWKAIQEATKGEPMEKAFCLSHAASIKAREQNGWKPTPASFLEDVQSLCVEHGHGGLWNSMSYNTKDVISIDMKSCYPASFQGKGDAKLYFERFGLPGHQMVRISINGPLPDEIDTGFAELQEWEFKKGIHPVISSWFGRHFAEKGWAPTPLLYYLLKTGILTDLKVREAIVSFEVQTDLWFPEDRTQGCSMIGKFTQGSKAGGKRLNWRLVTDKGELDFLVRDTRQNGTLVGAPQKCPLGYILTYYDGLQPQYTHLRATMLAYAHINLVAMLQRLNHKKLCEWPALTAYRSEKRPCTGLKTLRLTFRR
ncbi:hypothetical protein OS493_004301 [Desmophyllum pertusum]|uniref:Uncharacterized protein n=1 Tax=Desmophyllum pertusum TaxID=174260 RepID=A0A9W9ZT92_9CNID|nr:hypothetical protein OS493_004301 [Desmophyllum pertusum]